MRLVAIACASLLVACSSADQGTTARGCFDELDRSVACEDLGDTPEVARPPSTDEPTGGADQPGDDKPTADDRDGMEDEAVDVAFDSIPAGDELERESAESKKPKLPGEASTVIAYGRTDTPEVRETIPIGRTSGATRYVVMRLKPADLPNLRADDVLRAAAEIQVTTRCDIGQVAPGCNYTPNVRMQILLSGDPNATHANGSKTIALSDVKGFDCTKDEHHCVKIINFTDAAKTLTAANAPSCVADNSCYLNFVMWAYNDDARSGGDDKLIIGANEGNYLDNHKTEQDRGRLMLIRERNITADDKAYRFTKDTVSKGSLGLTSNGDWKRIYSHTLNGGNDLKAGQKYRVWMHVDATANHRVNLSFQFFLTKNRFDHNGGSLDDTAPRDFSEHNGTNCSPTHDCHVSKIAVFEVKRDIKGPVYVNVAASTEVPGPGSAQTTIKNSGYVKSIRYSE